MYTRLLYEVDETKDGGLSPPGNSVIGSQSIYNDRKRAVIHYHSLCNDEKNEYTQRSRNTVRCITITLNTL